MYLPAALHSASSSSCTASLSPIAFATHCWPWGLFIMSYASNRGKIQCWQPTTLHIQMWEITPFEGKVTRSSDMKEICIWFHQLHLSDTFITLVCVSNLSGTCIQISLWTDRQAFTPYLACDILACMYKHVCLEEGLNLQCLVSMSVRHEDMVLRRYLAESVFGEFCTLFFSVAPLRI